MRFAFAHKMSTYLMVWSSFFALVLSGELGGLVVILGLVAISGSWFWEPPRIRFERYSLAWTILSALVLAGSVFAALTGGDFLLIGAQFIIYLLVAKLYNRRGNRDYQQVYILTFLALVAGTVLNTEFSYGLFFLFYVVAATWALILFHLRREMEDNFLLRHSEGSSHRVQVDRILGSRRIVGRRFFVGTAAVSFSIFLVASLLFLMIPRIGFGLFFQKNRSGIHLAGFSDGVSLGGHGVIKTDSTVVMRVQVESSHQGRRAPYIHWRGVAFDYYANGQWRRSPAAPRTKRTTTLVPNSNKERHNLLYAQDDPGREALDRRAEGAMRQAIYLEPLGSDVLFGASMPVAFEFASHIGMRRPRKASNDEIRYSHSAGIKYVVYSELDPPPADLLRATPGTLPEGFRAYLQLPDPDKGERTIPRRVIDKAHEVTAGASNNYDKAVALERWLQNNLAYTLEMKSPGDMEPIDFFLFERRQGHCEYFASAMTVMARAVGLPARNVNGFLGGEWNEFDDFIAVRAGDAHSWVEVYFDGHGWVTFDPTPSAEVDRLGRGDGGLRDRLRRFFDSLRFKWFQWVIEYDLYRQLSLFKKMSNALKGSADRMKLELGDGRQFLKRHKATLAAVLGGAVGVVVLIALLRRRRRLETLPEAERRRRARAPMATLYAGVLRTLERRGYRRKASVTPREHAAQLARDGAPGGEALVELTEIYYAAEYGAADAEALLARARELADAIGEALRRRRRAG